MACCDLLLGLPAQLRKAVCVLLPPHQHFSRHNTPSVLRCTVFPSAGVIMFLEGLRSFLAGHGRSVSRVDTTYLTRLAREPVRPSHRH